MSSAPLSPAPSSASSQSDTPPSDTPHSPAPWTAAPPRPPWYAALYTHNPFYAISAFLMLYGVRTAYGELEIGSINCWIMMGVLAGYTLVLAGIAVSIIRWGRVWDDARSLLLLLLLLFLAVSISADDLLAKTTSAAAGAALVLCGFAGSALVSEIVLRCTRIRLGWGFRGPYHLLLALFYVFPWLCSPELRPRSPEALEWLLCLFPTLAAGLFLLLWPAVRRGPDYTANNGTPWNWPWFPWMMFGVLAAAVALRSFVLTMTCGPQGPIWTGPGLNSINFETIFGPYFLIPLAFVLLWLAQEAALVAGNRTLQQRILLFAPLLLLLTLPLSDSQVFRNFLAHVVERCGSPLWLTGGMLLLFYSRAWLAEVPNAGVGWCSALLLFAVIGPDTISLHRPIALEPWPIFVVGAAAAVLGVRRRSSELCLAGAVLLVCGLGLVLPQTVAADFRMTLCYHLLWGAVIAIGVAFRDRLANLLRIVGAVQMPITALVALVSSRAEAVPMSWRLLYVLVVAGAALALAGLLRNRWYLSAFFGTLALTMYAGTVVGFRQAVLIVGRPAMMALTWSVAALLVAFLISASKANWLPWRRTSLWLPEPSTPPGSVPPGQVSDTGT